MTTTSQNPNKEPAYRPGECRYCDRYSRACGRGHSEETRSDWARTWKGTKA